MTADFKLPPEAHERIYAKIAQDALPLATPQDRPVAIITGGQPGSGKSGITDEAKRELSGRGGFVLVDADEVRSWHPDYHALQKLDDTTAANKTHPDAGAWANRLGREAVATRRNVIFDQTSKDPVAVADLTRQLRAAGYEVRLYVMAVNPLVSEQRIYTRYEQQKARTGHGRFATKENHDIAFAGVLNSVAAVEQGRLVDRLRVSDKDHRILFENSLSADREWLKPARAAATMEAERSRPLSLRERSDIVKDYGMLVALVQAPSRGASPQEKQVVQGLRERAEREYLAEAFRRDWVVEARFSERLNGARAVLVGVQEKAQADGLAPELAAAVVLKARQMIAERIGQGEAVAGPGALDVGLKAPGRDRGLER